jgi:hypothetical protein
LLSEVAVFRGAREGNDVADVFDAGDVHDQPLEPDAETGVNGAAEFP